MTYSDYLVVGGSHAGLAAIDSIRAVDPEANLLLLSREERPPYSPTILPHVVTGRVAPEEARLRDEYQLNRLGVTFCSGAEVAAVDAEAHRVGLVSGEELEYGKLLLATGAAPAVPAIPGLQEASFYVLRTLDDAVRLRERMLESRRAVVIGAGLIGLHAAECLLQGGCDVTVLEALPQILPGYFDATTALCLQEVLTAGGIRLFTGRRTMEVGARGEKAVIGLDSGEEVEADLLLVAAGVRCATECLEGSGIDADQGVRVDRRMRTNVPDVWAAGDVVQSVPFFGGETAVIPNVINAVDQGRTAGLDMAGDRQFEPCGAPLAANTSSFLGHRAFSVGLGAAVCDEEEFEIEEYVADATPRRLKLVFRNHRLVGAAGIDMDPDPGILVELIRREVDLSDVRKNLADDPKTAGRILMSHLWG